MYWTLLKLKADGTHPVSHTDLIILKTKFDEAGKDPAAEVTGPGGFTVPVERSAVLKGNKTQDVWLDLTKPEFDAGGYKFHIWAEAVGIAAFRAKGVFDDLAVGRLTLQKAQEKQRAKGKDISPRPPTISDEDDVIVYEIDLVNSVIQYIVDEMNTNRSSDFVSRRRDIVNDPVVLQPLERVISLYDAFHQFHTDEDMIGVAQDIAALGGGHWDHKPRMRPVWGAYNRLGNQPHRYYYDYWSNIHFGFIMALAQFGESTALAGANTAQIFDRGGVETRFDIEPTRAGWRLGLVIGKRQVTRGDIITILNGHTHWQDHIRKSMIPVSKPSTIDQIKEGVNQFERMSPIDQATTLRRMFGGY